MKGGPRVQLLVQAAALAAASAAVLLLVGLPLLARRALGPREFLLLAALDAAVVAGLGAAILLRWVGRPLDRLLAAARRLGRGGGLPPLGPPGEEADASLDRAALAFERTAAALAEERARLAAKVAELEAANARLAEAREGLVRSETLATVGRLAAGIAHEVGNPLGAVSGYAALARQRLAAGAPPAAVEDFLARIDAEAARIDAIVRDLLDFARPSRLDLAPLPVAGALEAAARLARMQPRFKGVALVAEGLAALPPVRADERRLVQVFLNLLLNAADAMGGGGEVRVEGRAVAREEGGGVALTLADSGPGIPPALRARVFEPFFTTKEPGRGTGLGLAVCHGLMASMGGRIEVDEGPGGGARFTLWLRRDEA